jgi:hypothetical protein
VKLIAGAVAIVVALAFAVPILAGTALELVNVFVVAGWWGLLVLIFPAFIAFAVWKGWGDTP